MAMENLGAGQPRITPRRLLFRLEDFARAETDTSYTKSWSSKEERPEELNLLGGMGTLVAGSPREHLMSFLDDLGIHLNGKELSLKEFSKSLSGRAFTWYAKNYSRELMKQAFDVAEAMKKQGKRTKDSDSMTGLCAMEDRGKRKQARNEKTSPNTGVMGKNHLKYPLLGRRHVNSLKNG
ncbi:hypothetical protein SESBI_48634 [Sesbania bispinosa]|nr:hypothetical protein SESBI_48634 [Sesbania bispinosa]